MGRKEKEKQCGGLQQKTPTMFWRMRTIWSSLSISLKIKQDMLPCERKPVKCLEQNISWDQDLCQTLERLESVVV